MKKVIGFCFSILFIATTATVDAHPGRTDSNGGHTCRTNCAKWGLQQGEYHYHNGNGTSSRGSNQTQPIATPQPSAEEIRQQETTAGYNAGYTAGATYGATTLTSKTEEATEGSEAYKEGYVAGYQKGVEEAQQQLKQHIEQAKQAGEQAGEALESEEVPAQFLQPVLVKEAYESAFAPAKKKAQEKLMKEYKAQGEKDGLVFAEKTKVDEMFQEAYESGYTLGKEQKEKELYQQGYEAGYALKSAEKLEEKFISSYQQGYKAGELDIEKATRDEGYQLAFTAINYENPYDKAPLTTWHQEGYDANEERAQITTTAYESGLAGEKYQVPKAMQQAASLYKYHYDLGYEEYKQKQNSLLAVAGVGVVAGGSGYYLYRRNRKNKIQA